MKDWLFTIVFLCSMLLAWVFTKVSADSAREMVLGAFGLFLGGAMLALCWEALSRGYVKGKPRSVKRDTHPVSFWGFVTVYFLAGAPLIVVGLIYIFFGGPIQL